VKCPTCTDSSLIPTKFAEGLPSFTCPSCEGHLIEILSYRFWTERTSSSVRESVNLELPESKDSKHALVCPQCNKLMTKFLISDAASNKIDLCGNCGRFWVDGGEWALVESLNLDTSLTKIFNEPWQKAIRQARVMSDHENRLREKLSDDDVERLVQLREWIIKHPLKAEIIDYLNRLQA
jgi:Zn-finger nucleic acid-binding protein